MAKKKQHGIHRRTPFKRERIVQMMQNYYFVTRHNRSYVAKQKDDFAHLTILVAGRSF